LNKLKIACVSYLNAQPFVFGFENYFQFKNETFDVSYYNPKICAQLLIEDKIDLGLVPVASIPQIKNAEIVSNYCISAFGKVHSVCLYSQVPLQQIKNIYLDYESMTSVNLCKILCENFWKIKPVFANTQSSFIEAIVGNNAGVVIGDRTFELENKFEFVYDLSEQWYNYTQKPFVFAAWVTNKKLSNDTLRILDNTFKFGVENINEIIEKNSTKFSKQFLEMYFKKNIQYNLNSEKKEVISEYLQLLSQLK
jgi:chorismate dehydratase